MIKKRILLFILLASGLYSVAAEAKLYKWVDDKGVTHYGETVPPEYANKDRSELSKTGRIINSVDILTPEERRAKAAADAKIKADQEAERDRHLHDSSLLNTYSDVKEIDLAKTRNMQQLDARAQVASKQLIDANKTLADFKTQADVLTRSGKGVSAYLTEDIANAQKDVDKLNKDINTINTSRATLAARYDADRARYLELTKVPKD